MLSILWEYTVWNTVRTTAWIAVWNAVNCGVDFWIGEIQDPVRQGLVKLWWAVAVIKATTLR